MAIVLTALILVAALINFLPVLGVLGGRRLSAAYGITLADPNLQILMRHRALLFGILGGYMLFAAFCPDLRPAAYLMGLASMLGFLLLCWQVGSFNVALKKIAWVDVLGLIALMLAMLIDYTVA